MLLLSLSLSLLSFLVAADIFILIVAIVSVIVCYYCIYCCCRCYCCYTNADSLLLLFLLLLLLFLIAKEFNFNSSDQLHGEISLLDDAGTYFDLGPRMVTGTGTYYYMSTRNNAFSNRSQKGRIIVKNPDAAVSKTVGYNGGSITNRYKDRIRELLEDLENF